MAEWYDNIPTPVDANGNVVPLDTRELVWRDKTREVWNIAYSGIHGRWVACLANGLELIHLSACTLPDSWERLERDAIKSPCEYFGQDDDSDSSDCPDCPAHNRGCVDWMTLDIVRRAKALAGVTDGE